MTKQPKIYNEKNKAFTLNGAGLTVWLAIEKMEIDLYLSPCINLKSMWIKNHNIKPDALNLIEENMRKSLELLSSGEIFLNRTSMAHALRSRIDK